VERVSITATGSFAIRVDEIRQALKISGPTLEMLMLLASHYNRRLRRDFVINAIWDESCEAKARSALSTAIWRINKLLEPFKCLAVESCGNLIALCIDEGVDFDLRNIESAVDCLESYPKSDFTLEDDLRSTLQAIIKRSNGGLFEGCDALWAMAVRERVDMGLILIETRLMRDATERGEYETAIKYGRSILMRDALREGTQRELMWLYVLNGQRAQAIRQYFSLCEQLRDELDLDPMPETKALYNHILGENYEDNSQSTERKLADIISAGSERLVIFRSLADISI